MLQSRVAEVIFELSSKKQRLFTWLKQSPEIKLKVSLRFVKVEIVPASSCGSHLLKIKRLRSVTFCNIHGCKQFLLLVPFISWYNGRWITSQHFRLFLNIKINHTFNPSFFPEFQGTETVSVGAWLWIGY